MGVGLAAMLGLDVLGVVVVGIDVETAWRRAVG